MVPRKRESQAKPRAGGQRRGSAAASTPGAADLRRDLLSERGAVRDLDPKATPGVAALLAGMRAGGGFTAKKLALAVDVLARAVRDPDTTLLLSFPAALMATGARGSLVRLVAEGWVDGVVTTCGTWDHDLARTWGHYYAGSFEMDDRELHREGVNRLGNVLVPNESYGELLEERLAPFLADLYARAGPHWPTAALSRELGLALAKEKGREGSLLWQAAQRKVPVFVPGPTDGAVGSQVWLLYQKRRDLRFDLLADEQALSDLVHERKKVAALMIGGGISKHHTIWWAQFVGGLESAVYLTTAVEHDGSLSGARIREAVSWGKVKEEARYVTVEGDATITLPLLVAGLLHGAAEPPREVHEG